MKFTVKAHVPTACYRRRLAAAGRRARGPAEAAIAMAMTEPKYEDRLIEIDANNVIEVIDAPSDQSPIRSILRMKCGQSVGVLTPGSTIRAIVAEIG